MSRILSQLVEVRLEHPLSVVDIGSVVASKVRGTTPSLECFELMAGIINFSYVEEDWGVQDAL